MLRALLLLFGGTGILGVLSVALPGVSGWLQALLAALLLVVPGFVLRPSGLRIDDLGVDMGPWRRTLAVSGIAMLVVFPPFVLGHHVLQTRFLGAGSSWSWSALERWDEALRDPPDVLCDPGRDALVAWTTDTGLWLLAPPGSRLEVAAGAAPIRSARAVTCEPDGTPRARRPLAPTAGRTFDAGRADGLWLSLEGVDRFDLAVRLDGRPVPADRMSLGAFGRAGDEDGRLAATRSLWWILTYLVVHLGLVALPEEWFFRGYLQARLDRRLGTPWRLFGASIGPGLLWSALAFALLHPILIPGFHRLLVFFPALLFGWLRARTGALGAPVVVHAASNLLLAAIGGMYR